MGIRSDKNWSGTIVNGVLLGEPAVDEDTGEMHWDGGVPSGVLDAVGMFLEDGLDGEGKLKVKVDPDSVFDIKYKTAEVKVKEVFVEQDVLDENGDLVLDEEGEVVTRLVPAEEVVPFFKGEIVEFEGDVYEASKDTFEQPPHNDWVAIKTKAPKDEDTKEEKVK